MKDTVAQGKQSGLYSDSHLDCSWIKEILIKRASNCSSVACVTTSDPVRALQLKAYVAMCGDYANSQVYSFSPWRGLEQLNRGDNRHLYFELVKQQAGEYAEMAGVHNQILDLNESLRHMDEVLKGQRCVWIMEHLDGPRDEEKERYLLYALREWAHDPEVIRQGSLVILVVGSISKVLDELTKEHAVQEQPPIASASERGKIIDDIACEFGINVNENRETLVLATAGLNLHQLQSSLREAYQRTGTLPVEFIRELKNDFIKRSEFLEIAEPAPEGFASIGGYQEVKDFVIRNIVRVLEDPGRARGLRMRLPRGFILFGPPGTGKSAFARCLAGEINLPIINMRTENLFSKYLGESGHRFRDAIYLAEQMSPAILFVDEIDKLLGARISGASDGASNEARKVQDQVLEWLGGKGRQSILVGATNRPEDLDEAAIRPGRVDYMIPMLYPDFEARRQILKVHLELAGDRDSELMAMTSEEAESLVTSLAEQTTNFTGAELEQLVDKAKRNAFHGGAEALRWEDLTRALDSFRIDLVSREKQKEKYRHLAHRFASDSEFFGDRL